MMDRIELGGGTKHKPGVSWQEVSKMKELSYEENVKEYGQVTKDNLTVALTEHAQASNVGTEGGVEYRASAIDKEGNEYMITWDTIVRGYEPYDNEEDEEDEEDEDECDGLLSDRCEDCTNKYLCEDEANACDWDSPESIERGD